MRVVMQQQWWHVIRAATQVHPITLNLPIDKALTTTTTTTSAVTAHEWCGLWIIHHATTPVRAAQATQCALPQVAHVCHHALAASALRVL
jgi:hypothetical protein